MIVEPTIDDFTKILTSSTAGLTVQFIKEAEKIHTSQPFSFLWGGDTRLERLLDHYVSYVEKACSLISDSTIQFLSSTKLDQKKLLMNGRAALEVVTERIFEDLEWRLRFLAETPAQLELAKQRIRMGLDSRELAWRRVLIGIGTNAMTSNTKNIIKAHTIAGDIQQGSPGATMKSEARFDPKNLKKRVSIAEKAASKCHSKRQAKVIVEKLTLLKAELAPSKPDKRRVERVLQSIRVILEQTAANVLGTELTAALRLLVGGSN